MLKNDGRQLLTVGKGTAAVLLGHDDVTSWDDEELAHGRRRDTNGNFTGRPPRLIPHQCWVELKKRQLFDAESTFGEAVAGAARYLADVAEGRQQPQPGRITACQILFDRFIGKPKESVDVRMSVTAQVEQLPWVQTLRASARIPSAIEATATRSDDEIIDAEVIEPDLCLCGCGQPPRPGSLYFNARHQEHAERKRQMAAQPPVPTPVDDDPILTDEDDEFIEDPILSDDDDPVLW